jgi:hypothetical protein
VAWKRTRSRADSRAGWGHGPFADPPAPALARQMSPCPLGRVDGLAEPRGRHARLDADRLEVLEGLNLPSADFSQTRDSTAASPSAWASSATSASASYSRVEGRNDRLPTQSCPLRGSRPSTVPMDCSDAFSRREESAMVVSPASTLRAIRVFRSAGITEGV